MNHSHSSGGYTVKYTDGSVTQFPEARNIQPSEYGGFVWLIGESDMVALIPLNHVKFVVPR